MLPGFGPRVLGAMKSALHEAFFEAVSSAEGTPQQQMGGARREQQDKYRLERDALERLWQSGKGEDEGGLGDDRRPS